MVRTTDGAIESPAPGVLPATWVLAVAIVTLEVVTSLAGVGSLLLVGAALIAPGWALAGLLPPTLRRSPVAVLTCGPALGISATSLALISLATAGVPLTPVTVHFALALLLAAGWFVTFRPAWAGAEGSERPLALLGRATDPGRRALLIDLLLLSGVVGVALVLGWRVIGSLPVPGDDWAKYLLYADEIRKHGTLALQNQLWMGGRPFSEDPGIPSLEGAALLITGAEAGALVRVILVLSLLQVAAAFGAARAQLGLAAAVVTGLLIAVVPASHNILGWHGLANAGALAILALVLAQLGAWLSGELDRRAQVGLALTILGVAAAHRLTALFLGGTLLLVLAAVAAFGPARRRVAAGSADTAGSPDTAGGRADSSASPASTRRQLLTQAARTLAWTVGLGALLIVDLQRRASESGGTLPYTSYLTTKVDLELALRDLSWLLVALAGASVLVLMLARRLPRVVWPALALALVAIGLGWAWVVQLPLYYSRIVFFLPLPLAVLAGAGAAALAHWARTPSPSPSPDRAESDPNSSAVSARPRPGARLAGSRRTTALLATTALGVAMAGGVIVTAGQAWRQAEEVREYYAFASPRSLAVLDDLKPQLRPGEIVATDRCWSFLATWLLGTRTYPALEEQDIQPKAELMVARRAAAILQGTPEGRRLIRELPVRFAIVDPTCPVNSEPAQPPGELLFAGDRMAIIRLDPDAGPR